MTTPYSRSGEHENPHAKTDPSLLTRVDRIAARVCMVLAALYIVFIAAASLTVGAGEFSLSQGAARINDLHASWVAPISSVHDLRDIATNELLYLPLGVLIALAGAAPTRSLRRRLYTPWLFVGTAVSVSMETLQVFSARTPDVLDLMTNTSGYLLGLVATGFAIHRFHLRPAMLLGLDDDHVGDRTATAVAGLIFLYLFVYGIGQLVPFDITVSLGDIYHKLTPRADGTRFIILDPLYHLRGDGMGSLSLIYAVLGIVPVAALRAYLDGLQGKSRLTHLIWLCVLLAGTVEVAQVFIVGRTSDISAVMMAPIAALLGFYMARGWLHLRGLQLAEIEGTGSAEEPGFWRMRRISSTLAMAMLVYILFLSALAWSPYQFELDVRVALDKLRSGSNWIPFREHIALHSLPAARDLVEEAAQFVPLGLLAFSWLTFAMRRAGILLFSPARPWVKVALVAGFCGAVACTLEVGQVFCRGRYVDITDILLGVMGGTLGAMMWRLFIAARPAMAAQQVEHGEPAIASQSAASSGSDSDTDLSIDTLQDTLEMPTKIVAEVASNIRQRPHSSSAR